MSRYHHAESAAKHGGIRYEIEAERFVVHTGPHAPRHGYFTRADRVFQRPSASQVGFGQGASIEDHRMDEHFGQADVSSEHSGARERATMNLEFSEPMRVGVVGAGVHGGRHARVLARMPNVEFVGVYDTDGVRAAKVATQWGVQPFPSLDAVADACEAVIVAVDTSAHCEVGCALLRRRVHVFMEKPIASTLAEADALVAAVADDRVFAVGHIEYFNPGVQALMCFGLTPQRMQFERLAVHAARCLDTNVVLDLMIHDLQILHLLDPSPIVALESSGASVVTNSVDHARVVLQLASGCVVHLEASKVAPHRSRTLRLSTRDRTYNVDYLEQRLDVEYQRADDPKLGPVAETLHVGASQPLETELSAFVSACAGYESDYVDAPSARRALDTALRIMGDIASSIQAPRAASPVQPPWSRDAARSGAYRC